MIINTDLIYPIGAIYISTVSTNPGNLFGGTWERIKDVFLLAAGDTYNAGSTGGAATVALSVSEMPQHNHTFPYYNYAVSGGGGANGLPYNVTNTAFVGNDRAGMMTAGSSAPHNNMPPYLTVYVWKRVS